jgi:hypothetical protein
MQHKSYIGPPKHLNVIINSKKNLGIKYKKIKIRIDLKTKAAINLKRKCKKICPEII